MSFAMRRSRGAAAILAIAAIALVGLAAFPTDAPAHPGGLSPKDQCHRNNAAGERHWHKDGTAERAGPCVEIDGTSWRFGDNAICAAERAAIADAREASRYDDVPGETASALVTCVQDLEPPLSAACGDKLAWLVDGNGRFGGSVPIDPDDLSEIADLCLGRPARE